MEWFDRLYNSCGDISFVEESEFKNKFYKTIKEYGFDFDDIDEETRLPKSMIPVVNNEFEAVFKFNYALEMMHRKKQVPILFSIDVLINDFFDPTQLMKFIQTNILNYLQLELRKKLNKFPNETSSKLLKFIS